MANTKPTATVRIGSIKAAIWTNDNSGGIRHSVTFERLYKDGDSWKATRSFSRDDLLVLAKVADLAYSRILELQEQPESSLSPPSGPAATAGPPSTSYLVREDSLKEPCAPRRAMAQYSPPSPERS